MTTGRSALASLVLGALFLAQPQVALATQTAGSGFPPTTLAGSSGPQITAGVPIRPVVMKSDLRVLNSTPRARDHVFPVPRPAVPSPLKSIDPTAPKAEQPSALVSAPIPAPVTTFAGLDHLNWGDGYPPDPVGDVGPTYFIQAVNSSLGVFRKADGLLVAAATLDGLWLGAGTGTACDTAHQGDPTVVYDPMADRWFVADFAFANSNNPPYYECIAVSRSGDPVSGGWYLYALRTDDLAHPWLADYPKMGIWPDGLYMTANMFLEPSGTFKEVRVWALNRTDMEAGAAARLQIVDLGSTSYFGLLPSNVRTATGVPPAGRANILVAESTTLFAFDVFTFRVDYTGAGSTFTGPSNVSQTAYAVAASTVPTPANSLDSLPERLMMQAQYANLNGVESVSVQHTVRCCGSGTPAGIQWAQLNVTGGIVAATPIQQQLYPGTNDGLHRWMGSLALDRNGDMALGYSVANATTMPDIRYAGRLSGDALGTLPQTETTLLPGITRGSQSGVCGSSTCIRWGDYSAMTLDPDGCTFWYTNEYYATTGLNWQTRIGSFRFASCVPIGAVPTVTSVSPNSGSTVGGTAITITGANFAAPATVDVGGAAATDVSVVNATTISATTPAHAAGAVHVTVTASGQTSVTNSADTFTYITPPPPCTSTSWSASPLSPQLTGTTITFTVTASGCTQESQILIVGPSTNLFLNHGGVWTSAPLVWDSTGAPAGTYNVYLYSRAVGSAGSYQAFYAGTYALNAGPP